MQEAFKPIAGHSVFLLLVQLAVILIVSRAGAELAKRVSLPAVVGELAAGLVLGPTLLGHFAPEAFTALFPPDQAQFHLLDVIGTLGMVLLLLLTGLETDVRLLKNLGRAALIASIMGMFVPFATGFGFGLYMPDEYLAQPDQRTLFALFIATAMSISAMPVIAKILMDLDLTRRNIGLVILSAGVVDDTAGWLLLSAIAGVASHGEVQVASLASTLVLSACFMVAAAVVIYPSARVLMSIAARRFKTPDADLVMLLVVTFLCAAATEYIGIHAVFGAFVAGTIFRQVPHMKSETVHRLESFVFSVLAPVFFGIVGLKVDLWKIGGGSILLIALAVASLGKLIGCTIGSLWGGLRFWEGLSIAVAMNARGAMELVVATIGLSLGILNQQMFSIIVVIAIFTSFMAPLGLRLTMKKVRMTDDEVRRMLAEQSKGMLDPARVRVLLPTAGGPNTPQAALVAAGLAQRSVEPVSLLFVNAPTRLRDRLRDLFRRSAPEMKVDEQLNDVRRILSAGPPPSTRRVEHDDIAQAILAEAERGFDLIVIGASHRGHSLGGPVLADVVEQAPCHVLVVKAGRDQRSEPYTHLFVPFDGGVFARVAVELAVRYAEATAAQITIAILSETRPPIPRSSGAPEGPPVQEEPLIEDDLTRISNIFRVTEVRPQLLRLRYDARSNAMSTEAESGKYDLVVIGAENRAVQHRLFFGHDNEQLIRDASVAVAIAIPNVAYMGKGDPSTIASLQRPGTGGETPIGSPPPRAASSA